MMLPRQRLLRIACFLAPPRGHCHTSSTAFVHRRALLRRSFASHTSLLMNKVDTFDSLPYPRAAVAVTVQSRVPIPDDGSGDLANSKDISFENYYLLIQRANPPDQGKWSLPGGKIEVGEATIDAARRELMEETQISPEVCEWHPHPFLATDAIFTPSSRIVGFSKSEDDSNSYQSEDADTSIKFHYLIAQCFARAPDCLPTPSPSDDALDAKWWTLASIKEDLVPQSLVSAGVVGVITRAEDLCAKDAMDL